MAIQSVTLKFNAKKTNGQFLYPADITSTKPTRSEAITDIGNQIQAKVDAATAVQQDELDAQTLFNT
jgi:hypothetical protein